MQSQHEINILDIDLLIPIYITMGIRVCATVTGVYAVGGVTKVLYQYYRQRDPLSFQIPIQLGPLSHPFLTQLHTENHTWRSLPTS